MVLRLFSKQSIFSLVDILFKDMQEDAKKLQEVEEDDLVEEEEDEDEEEEDDEAGDEEPQDPTKYGYDMDEYLDTKGILTIEGIKDIVGEIMSTCQKKISYDILEYILKGKVFEKKIIRESFLQEILNAQG
jgi:hypothetical protein